MSDARLQLPEGYSNPLARRQCVSSYASVYNAPDAAQSQVTELIYGQSFDIYEESGGFCFGQLIPLIEGSTRPGYVGWVEANSFGECGAAPTHRVSSSLAPLFTRPDIKSPIRRMIPAGSRLSQVRQHGEGHAAFIETDQGGFVSVRHVRPLLDLSPDLVEAARLYLGQPYIWGGSGARGVDCSGLVQMACDACGIDSPRDADMQEAELGERLSMDEGVSEFRRGDLLFWPGHVAFVSGDNLMLHANAFHMATVEEPLDDALVRMERSGLFLRSVRRLSH